MAAIPTGVFTTLGKSVFSGARLLRQLRQDDREMGLLLQESLARAIRFEARPAGLDASAVEAAVGEIGRALRKTPFPEPSPSLAQKAKAKVPKLGGLIERPKKRLLSEPHPVSLLEEWLKEAMRTRAVGEALDALGADPPVTRDGVVSGFRLAFELELIKDPPSEFRAELLDLLGQRRASEELVADIRRRRDAALGIAATVGLAVGSAGDVVRWDTPEAALVGTVVALVTAGAGALVNRRKRGRASKDLGRDAALRLVAEIIDPELPLWALSVDARESEEGRAAAVDRWHRAKPPGSELLDDLSQRLIPEAERAGDGELAAVLRQLEDRLRRWTRHPASAVQRIAVAEALRDVAEVATP